MGDTTIKKLDSSQSPQGEMGQTYLATGTQVGMRLWKEIEPGNTKPERARDYETVGYVLSGQAELTLEGQTVTLSPGDSWVVPAGAAHTYRIQKPFSALEATAPPASAKGRDREPGA